jgi:glycosyltransferase involved in cell wall biosynthesis
MVSEQVEVLSPLPENKIHALHVVHLIESLGPGGAERLLYTNLKHFDAERVRSTVITVFSHDTHWLEPITELGVAVISLKCQSAREIPKGVRRLRAWLRANRPDVIHSHLWAANIIGRIAGRITGIPVVSSVHNPDHEPQAWADGAEVSLLKRQTAKALDRWTANLGSDRLIAVSNYVRESARRDLHFSLDSIDLVYNPVDSDLFKTPVEKNRTELWRDWGLPPQSFVLLNVARVSPQKGLLYALRALPAIIGRFPLVHLVSVGATTDPQWPLQLEREAESLGVKDHFHMLGAQRNVMDFLRACDVFVFPSLYEGLGIALMEAMAAGCVCVASNTGPIPEVIQDGTDGILVPPADPAALAHAVCDLLGDPGLRSQLGTAATQKMASKFQPEESAKRLVEIYQSVVEHRLRDEF